MATCICIATYCSFCLATESFFTSSIMYHCVQHVEISWNFMKSQNLSASRHTLALESETSPFLELIRFDPGAEPGCEMRSMKTWSRVPGVLVPHTWALCPSSYMYAMWRIIWGQSILYQRNVEAWLQALRCIRHKSGEGVRKHSPARRVFQVHSDHLTSYWNSVPSQNCTFSAE